MAITAYEEGLEIEKDKNNEKSVPELKVISIDGVTVKSEIVGVEP